MATLITAPAEITIDPAGVPFIIGREDQLEDAVVSVEKDVFELRSLQSSRPQGAIQTGANLRLTIIFADMARRMEALALCYNQTVVTATTKRRISVSDNAGTVVTGKKVVLKPYIGATVDTNANNWLTLVNAQIVDLSGSTLNYGLASQQRLSITFDAYPNAQGVKFIFGDETA